MLELELEPETVARTMIGILGMVDSEEKDCLRPSLDIASFIFEPWIV
jgi:hypothetical protein